LVGFIGEVRRMNEKINILMVDDEPGKLLSYEAILNDLVENLIKAHWCSQSCIASRSSWK